MLGENAGTETIHTNTLVISARMEEFTEVDRYRLTLDAGTFLTAEVISHSVFGFGVETVITRLALFREDEGGTLTEAIATSTVTYEAGFDPIIIDAPITETGIYVVVVSALNDIYLPVKGVFGRHTVIPADSSMLVGKYWLLLYNLDHEVTTSTEEIQERVPDQGKSNLRIANDAVAGDTKLLSLSILLFVLCHNRVTNERAFSHSRAVERAFPDGGAFPDSGALERVLPHGGSDQQLFPHSGAVERVFLNSRALEGVLPHGGADQQVFPHGGSNEGAFAPGIGQQR